LLRQRSRPYLFSNSITPVVAAGSLRAIELLSSSTELVDRLRANTKLFRSFMANTGLEVLRGRADRAGDDRRRATLTPITAAAFEEGLHVVGFSYPVVPLGTARIRTQVSAGHSEDDLRFAADVFARVAAG
jgi:glycine C-acetyltransferase